MRRRRAVGKDGAERGRRRYARALRVVFGTLLLIAASSPWAGSDESAQVVYSGRPLAEILTELQQLGLPVVFTSNVVRPDMVVEMEPLGADLRDILEQVIAPHGLATTAGTEGAILVVPWEEPEATSATRVVGTVYSIATSQPLSGASVRVFGPELGPTTVVADEQGSFSISLDLSTTPQGLTLEWSRYGHLPRRLESVEIAAGTTKRFVVMMTPTPIVEDEVLVATSQHELLAATPMGPLDLSRDDIVSLPHLGNDLVRAISLLPGTAANDVSAQFHVRGGRRDETQIVLDGQELYEGYHLKDFDSALSLIDAQSLEHAELTTGGLPADYGDRMGGVLELTTVRPSGQLAARLDVGISGTSAGAGGGIAEGRGSWMAQARQGPLQLVRAVVGSGADDPEYWDAFGKFELATAPSSSLRVNVLASGDDLEVVETSADGEKDIASEFSNAYFWGHHQSILGQRVLMESGASFARVTRDRSAREGDDRVQLAILDGRRLEVRELKQAWSAQLSPVHSLSWGLGARRFDSVIDYRQDVAFDEPLALLRFNSPETLVRLEAEFRETHRYAHVSDRFRVGDAFTAELGARYDRYSQTDEAVVSPRLNLSYRWGDRTVVRAAWGRFVQSQRPYELQVEDGSLDFQPVERSEHWVFGAERSFGTERGFTLRAEVYRRSTDNPRSRFENLYEPLNNFPEVEPDRVKIEPELSVARGLELFARGRISARVGWWANYTYASTEDEVDGVFVPRPFDQPHSLNLNLDYHVTENWRLNLAWRYHTGWPTTPLEVRGVENEEGEVEFGPVLGELYSERFPDYHRLDLRATRAWDRNFGRVTLYIDVQNLYDRRNLAGFDIEIDHESGTLAAETERWVGIVPSAGVRFEF